MQLRRFNGHRILPPPATLFLLVILPLSAFPQGGGARPGGGDKRADQMEQQQQQQQQQWNLDQGIRDRSLALEQLPLLLWQQERDRERINALLRQNFQRRYVVIDRNSEELVELAATLVNDLAGSSDADLARHMPAKVARLDKLAHQIRTSLAGQDLRRYKPDAKLREAMKVAVSDDQRQALNEKIRLARATATRLRSSVEASLASSNRHMVSVDALQKAADRRHIDPNSLAILSSALDLERLAYEMRAELKALGRMR
jgi:hypothetical protein